MVRVVKEFGELCKNWLMINLTSIYICNESIKSLTFGLILKEEN